MQNTESGRGQETARDQIDLDPTQSYPRQRRADRRDGESLFGGYQGPERRTGRERRADA